MKLRLTVVLAVLLGMSVSRGIGQPADPDQMVLDQVKKSGSDLSKAHGIEFFLYFPTQAAATNAGATISQSGFKVETRRAAKGPGWLCKATKAMVPELKALQKIRKDFSAIASANGGEYDGWGAAVVK